MQEIRIRIMRIEDVSAVAALERATFSEPWTEDGFASALAQAGNSFLVAVTEESSVLSDPLQSEEPMVSAYEAAGCSQEKVIGYCGLYTAADEGEITNVAVAEAYRFRGAGGALVREVKKKARQQEVRRIFLEVRASNIAAQSLYEKHGFKTVGVRREFYRKPPEDAFVMRCDL